MPTRRKRATTIKMDSGTAKHGRPTYQVWWYVAAAVVAAVLIAGGWSIMRGLTRNTGSQSAVAAAVAGGSLADRSRLAALYKAFAELVGEQGRAAPVLADKAACLDALWRIGHLQVGTGWRVGARYPRLPAAIEQVLRDAGLEDAGELDDQTRAEIAAACLAIAEDLR